MKKHALLTLSMSLLLSNPAISDDSANKEKTPVDDPFGIKHQGLLSQDNVCHPERRDYFKKITLQQKLEEQLDT